MVVLRARARRATTGSGQRGGGTAGEACGRAADTAAGQARASSSCDSPGAQPSKPSFLFPGTFANAASQPASLAKQTGRPHRTRARTAIGAAHPGPHALESVAH